MSNITRTIRRNQARLVIGEYVNKRNKKKKTAVKVGGRSGALRQFWEKMRRDLIGDENYILSYIRCNPGKRHKVSLIDRNGGIVRRRNK